MSGMLSLSAWIMAGAATVVLLWRLPTILRRIERRQRAYADACDHFYMAAWPLVNDPRTPERLLGFLHRLSANLNNPKLVRQLLWMRLTGKMQANAEHPPAAMIAFAEDYNSLPSELQPRLAEATGIGLVANALSGGLLGELFLRLMVPNMEKAEDVAATLAPEMAPLLAA
jgi:hypothetical protein